MSPESHQAMTPHKFLPFKRQQPSKHNVDRQRREIALVTNPQLRPIPCSKCWHWNMIPCGRQKRGHLSLPTNMGSDVGKGGRGTPVSFDPRPHCHTVGAKIGAADGVFRESLDRRAGRVVKELGPNLEELRRDGSGDERRNTPQPTPGTLPHISTQH